MQRLDIAIAADGLTADILVHAGAAAGRSEVDAALTAAGVRSGIDGTAVLALAERLADPGYAGVVRIAHGRSPVAGADGRVEFAGGGPPLAGALCADGHIDYRERHLLQPVANGAVVLRIAPPGAGEPGCDVRGGTLPARPGVPATVRTGPGVERCGDEVIARRDGVLLAAGTSVDVVSLYAHPGDVDLRSGNLRTEGSIEIAGDVHETMEVTAGADVLVRGGVLSARVCAGGSVQIQQGVLGRDAVVEAGADLRCRHATAATLAAGGTLRVDDQLAHCRARAGSVRLAGGRGQVFGGELRARTAIDVQRAGTDEGAATLLSVADLADEPTQRAQRNAEAERAARSAARAADSGRFSRAKGNRVAVRAADRTAEERLRLVVLRRELLQQASITVRDVAHAGVRIQFGDRTLHLDEWRRAVRFRFDTDQDRICEEPIP